MKFHDIDAQGNITVQRVTSAQRGSTTPSVGRIVYDTDLSKLYYGDGSGWNEFGGGVTELTPAEYEYRQITGTLDEGGVLTKTQSGAGSKTATYNISNFIAGSGYQYELVKFIFIRCQLYENGIWPEEARVVCTYPDGSLQILARVFNYFTNLVEATGMETVVCLPINRLQTSFTLQLSCSSSGDSATYEIVGCQQLIDSTFEPPSFTGCILAYGGSAVPDGWLLCNGSAVSRTTYVDLFTMLGETYGPGDGINTFNVPDLRGRFILGANLTVTPADKKRVPSIVDLGDSGGEKEHVLTIDEMPSHRHGVNSEDNANNYSSINNNAGTGSPTSDTGGDQAHNTVPPYQVVNFLIKT